MSAPKRPGRFHYLGGLPIDHIGRHTLIGLPLRNISNQRVRFLFIFLRDEQRAKKTVPQEVGSGVVISRPSSADRDIGAPAFRCVDLAPLKLIVNCGRCLGKPSLADRPLRLILLKIIFKELVYSRRFQPC